MADFELIWAGWPLG